MEGREQEQGKELQARGLLRVVVADLRGMGLVKAGTRALMTVGTGC